MMTPLEKGTLEYRFRKALRERFDSQQEASVRLGIPMHRIQLACRGDLGKLTGDDFRRLSSVLPRTVQADLARRLFPYA